MQSSLALEVASLFDKQEREHISPGSHDVADKLYGMWVNKGKSECI